MYWKAIRQQAYEGTANFISYPVTINHGYEKMLFYTNLFVKAIKSLIIPVVEERWINIFTPGARGGKYASALENNLKFCKN